MNHLLGKDENGDDIRIRLQRGRASRYIRIRSLDERDDGIDPKTLEESQEDGSHTGEVRVRQRKSIAKI